MVDLCLLFLIKLFLHCKDNLEHIYLTVADSYSDKPKELRDISDQVVHDLDLKP
jgi:hypothetical protein